MNSKKKENGPLKREKGRKNERERKKERKGEAIHSCCSILI